MVKRHTTIPHNFFCITDCKKGIRPEVNCLPPFTNNPKIHGWFHKLSLFKAKRFGITGRILYMDLDVVIVNNIDNLFLQQDRFSVIEDWLYTRMGQKKFNSSVMSWQAGDYANLENEFLEKRKVYKTWQGDQDFITHAIPDASLWPSSWCVSYKWHRCWENIPAGARVVVFHGTPNPEEALDPDRTFSRGARGAGWIKNYWW